MMEFLQRPIAGLPVWAWLIAAAGGLGVAWYFHKQTSASAASVGTLGQNTAGQQPAIDTSQIDPYTGVPYTIESQINPATGLPAYYGGPGTTGMPGVTDTTGGTTTGGTTTGGTTTGGTTTTGSGGIPDTPGGPGGGFIQQPATIRSRYSGNTQAYDKANPGGVPFDTQPGAYETAGFVPYGAQVNIVGPAQQGPSNLGNTSWFPVSYNGLTGYVSALDLPGAPAMGGSRGVQATPYWPIPTDVYALRGQGA